MGQKILLVGDPRICPQVAYVMDWQNFEQVEQLTDADRYRDYKIVVCAFKKKSKKIVKIKDKTLNIIYLDDICNELDAEERKNVANSIPPKLVPLWRRIIDRFKSGEVRLAIIRRCKRHITLRNFKTIRKLPTSTLKLSEMFIKVLNSKPTNIHCVRLLNDVEINYNLELYGCCSDFVPAFGSLASADLPAVYNSKRARIIKLSALNHSHCFCNFDRCQKAHYQVTPLATQSKLFSPTLPKWLSFGIDNSCNLSCKMCRKKHYTVDTSTRAKLQDWVTKVLATEWVNQIPSILLATAGELFFSEVDQRLLNNLDREQISLLSNGTLFNQAQWKKISTRYSKVGVAVSVDAATPNTYQKIRGGNFHQLLQNLEMLAKLRRENKLEYFILNFVVQLDNYCEMVDFVHLAKRLNADSVVFTHLENRGIFYTKHKYRKQTLLSKHKCLDRRLYNLLSDPIFNDPIVDIVAFQPYMAASAKRYDK